MFPFPNLILGVKHSYPKPIPLLSSAAQSGCEFHSAAPFCTHYIGDLEVRRAELGAVPVGSVAGAEQSQRVQEGSSGFGGFYVLLLGDLNTYLVQAVPYPAAGEEVCYGTTSGQAFFKKLFVELCHFGFHVLVERGVGKRFLTEHDAPFSSFISRQGHHTGLFGMLPRSGGLTQGNIYGEQDRAVGKFIPHVVQDTARVTCVASHTVPPICRSG